MLEVPGKFRMPDTFEGSMLMNNAVSHYQGSKPDLVFVARFFLDIKSIFSINSILE
jgi:hypothetical protein